MCSTCGADIYGQAQPEERKRDVEKLKRVYEKMNKKYEEKTKGE